MTHAQSHPGRACLVQFFLGLVLLAGPGVLHPAGARALAPAFATANLSPVVQPFGLPRITWDPGPEARLTLDWASHHAGEVNGAHRVFFDGETRRYDLLVTGTLFRSGARWRLDLPYVEHGGGRLDGLIERWHRFFGLPDGGRPDNPRDRLLLRVRDDDGTDSLHLDHPRSGPGDAAGAVTLPLGGADGKALAGLRLEAPTGNPDHLLGSGGWDTAVWLAGSGREPAALGPARWHLAAGALYMSDSEILPERHRRWAAFGRAAGGWAPLSRLTLRAQIDGHTGLYRSPLTQLGEPALELRIGGTIRLWRGYRLDLGVSEDIAVETAPDITFHVGIIGG